MAGEQAAPRVILIVGANRGIGYYMVKRLLELGDFISVLDIETDNLEKLKENYPNQLISITADAAKDEDIARTVGRLGQVKLNDLSSVRTICPAGVGQEVYITINSRCGKCSVVAVLVVAYGRKYLKSWVFRQKEKNGNSIKITVLLCNIATL